MGKDYKEYLEMVDRKKICAGIVTYNPDLGKIRENLDHITNQIEKVYIIDNGSRNADEIGCLLLEYGTGCSLITNNENRGIATALNQLCRRAKKNGNEWILTLDQDSVCPDNLIDELIRHIDKECAIVAPKIVYRGNEQFSSNGHNDCEEVPWVITSASLTYVKAWENIGGFDEFLFIDKVDYDFCIRLNRAGYKVYRVNTVRLMHELGNLKCRNIAGRTIYVTNHSSFRRYYMARNSIYLSDKLKEKGAGIYILKNIVKVIFFEDGKMSKLKAIIKGVSDGLEKIRGGVLILLSTYNGEKYLKEQIDSLLEQEYTPVFILIRDDGSTDGTIGILEEYAGKHENIKIVEGENVGVINSFNMLMNHPLVDEFEYVAFCDQDDVWLPGKIGAAMESFDTDKSDVPQLYCSNLQVVDEKLQPIKLYHTTILKYNRYTAMVQNCATGCTQVFNKKAVELYREGIGKGMEMHDYWMFLVCIYIGKVFWDKNAFILYRQHLGNVVGAKEKSIRKALSNIQNAPSGKRQKMLTDFLSVYGSYLDEDEKKILSMIKDYDVDWSKRLRLVFSPRYHGYDYRVTFGFKYRAFSGRIY